ncbi:telomere capping, CST complex subunit-domain-containing protein [Tricharina praecox]|uniref:telomere capping, CST complex subunit-domain-containing protein n=1 Tax=Tricharina praecox TaxID=43433 RepID=UPI002220850B|nr:telomere capping, CST complex subunit-domain-containing protein [Tricharina praecox]KAI5858001.1 telomere capping, CST complex subunit-domain-containing protein [Tricharina praecox]
MQQELQGNPLARPASTPSTPPSTMSHYVPASTLLPLHELSSQPVGTKVRFLGCIRGYDHANAILTLTTPPKAVPRADVDITLALQTLGIGRLRDGCWFNVIGYITESKNCEEGVTMVDAIMLWDAGLIAPSKYNQVLGERLATEKEVDAHQQRMEM